jgi:hypothetical protein
LSEGNLLRGHPGSTVTRSWINCNPWISCVRLVHADFAW